MPRRTLAIGDIHGCSAALRALLEVIQPSSDDQIVTLGDYVDRGPDSCGVIDEVLRLRESCEVVSLLGNHETMMLSALEHDFCHQFWLRCGGGATLASYGDELTNLPPDHLDFLRDCRRYYETKDAIFVHANYDAHLPMKEQSEQVQLWQHLSNPMPPPHCSGKTVFVGHTPQTSGDVLDCGHLVGIDTFVFGGRWLTAIDVNSREIWQANKFGEVRTDPVR